MSYYVTDDLFNKVEGMSKAEILALIENANYTPSFYAGALDNGVSYLYTGIKPTDALLTAILEHGLGKHTLTDLELDAINANVFSVLFVDAKTVAAKSDGTNFYLNIVGESVSTLSSSNRIVKNYTTDDYVQETVNNSVNAAVRNIKEGTTEAAKATNATYAKYASTDTSKGTIEERLTNLGFKEGVVTLVDYKNGTIECNSLKKQGKYVIFNFRATDVTYNDFNVPVLLTIPEEFRPKNAVNMMYRLALKNGNEYNGYMYGKIIVNTDGNILIAYYGGELKFEIFDVGWETN